MSLLVICQVLGLFVNTLTSQMQLSQKKKNFSHIFSAFLKSESSFQHFEQKRLPYSLRIFEVMDCERRG